MTPQELQAAMPYAGARAFDFAQPMTDAMAQFGIDTPQRKAAFIAQVAVESGHLRYTKELGTAAYLDKYDTGPLAAKLGNTPEDDDDGARYCGRGLLQITGRANYQACGRALGMDLVRQPELLERPLGACLSAGWYWRARNLNGFADRDAFGSLTKAINGGYTHLDERIAAWLVARKALKI